MVAEVISNKETATVIQIIKKWINNGFIPEKIVSDNGKEFISRKFKELCKDLEIEHHLVSVEDHESNGRVERSIRTIRDGIFKLGTALSVEEKLHKIIEQYNKTYHIGIKCSLGKFLKRQSIVHQ